MTISINTLNCNWILTTYLNNNMKWNNHANIQTETRISRDGFCVGRFYNVLAKSTASKFQYCVHNIHRNKVTCVIKVLIESRIFFTRNLEINITYPHFFLIFSYYEMYYLLNITNGFMKITPLRLVYICHDSRVVIFERLCIILSCIINVRDLWRQRWRRSTLLTSPV